MILVSLKIHVYRHCNSHDAASAERSLHLHSGTGCCHHTIGTRYEIIVLKSARFLMIEATVDRCSSSSSRRNYEITCCFKVRISSLRLPLLTVAFDSYRYLFASRTIINLSGPVTMMQEIVRSSICKVSDPTIICMLSHNGLQVESLLKSCSTCIQYRRNNKSLTVITFIWVGAWSKLTVRSTYSHSMKEWPLKLVKVLLLPRRGWIIVLSTTVVLPSVLKWNPSFQKISTRKVYFISAFQLYKCAKPLQWCLKRTLAIEKKCWRQMTF